MKNNVIVTVVKSQSLLGGYNLTHNQYPGFKGITGARFGHYIMKRDAIQRANELMKCWNNEKQPS